MRILITAMELTADRSAGITASAMAHLSALVLVILLTEVHPFSHGHG